MTALAVVDRPGVVVHMANAFRPERDRSVQPVAQAQTVRGWLDAQGIDEFPVPTLCLFNGQPLMRADWEATVIGRGDICAFVALPQGGGGGGGGKSPLKTVLSIAIMVGGMYLGAAYGAAFAEAAGFTASEAAIGSLTYGKLFGGIISGAVSLAGGALLNALVPPPKPSPVAFSATGFNAPPAASPTYSLQGQGNSARLGQSIPSQYGRHRVFPDLIMAEPWSEYVDNEQFLYQPHCLGLGKYSVERISIAETDIANFKEISYEIVEPGGTISLFDVNVITRPEVSGQECLGPEEATDISAAATDKSFNSTSTDFEAIGVAVGDLLTTSGFVNGANNGTWTVASVTASKVTVSETGIVDEAAGASVELFPSSRIVGPFVLNPVDTTANDIGIDIVFPRGLYYANDSGGLDSRTATWIVEARPIDDDDAPTGSGTWTILGPDIAGTDISAAAADKSFNATTTDFVAEGVAVGQIITTSGFSTGANNGTWTVVSVTATKVTVSETGIVDEAAGASVAIAAAGESRTDSTNTAIRLSFKYALATAGRYEVRARRTDVKDTSSRAGHEIRWAGLKAFVDGPETFADVTLLLVKMRATDNLSQRTARAVNVIQTRKLPVWNSGTETWSAETATRSLVWAVADICKATYGAELADARLPLSDLAALDTTLAARGDTFDGVFDTKTTVWDALTRVTRCGRAVPILQGGIVRVVRDAQQSLPVAMFGPRNIVKGSFKVAYIMPSDDTADAVTVEYFNERTWKPAEITAKLADSSADKPATVSLFGCVTAAHATREGDYMAADNRYRRKMVTFRTELEGMIPTYGDLIAVTHDMPRWGQGGEVVDWDDGTDVLTLSEPLTWTAGETHYIALRERNGSLAGPFECEAGASAEQVHLLEALTLTPYTGSAEERTFFTFGPGTQWSQLCRVLAVKPRNGGEHVEITAVAEDNRVHVN